MASERMRLRGEHGSPAVGSLLQVRCADGVQAFPEVLGRAGRPFRMLGWVIAGVFGVMSCLGLLLATALFSTLPFSIMWAMKYRLPWRLCTTVAVANVAACLVLFVVGYFVFCKRMRSAHRLDIDVMVMALGEILAVFMIWAQIS